MVSEKYRRVSPPIGAASEGNEPRVIARRPTAIDWDNPHPLYAVWEITLACDLGCKHCGSRAGPARPDELTTAECLDVVAQLDEVGIREVTLIGGEAYLRDDWDVIAADITRRGMRCGITTGAMNLDDERIARAVMAGVSTISISIDGLERTHDAQRGVQGSWRNAVAAARKVAQSPIRLATNSQINRLSMPELAAIARLLVDMGSEAWQIQLTVPMGHSADRPNLLLQPYELLELFPLLVWIKRELLVPGDVWLFPGNNIGYFGPYESALRHGGDRGAHWQGCSAGKWSIGLEADGKIKSCPSLTHHHYGSGTFRDTRLAEALQSDGIAHLNNRTRDDLWGFCQSCYYADTCLAGCTWTSHVTLGKAGNNPLCIHRALDRERAGLRERICIVEMAPGDPFDNGRFELTLEQDPEGADDAPTVLGFPLDVVTGLEFDVASIHEPDYIDAVLGGSSRKQGRVELEKLALGTHRYDQAVT